MSTIYDRGALKDVYKIVTGDKSWIYAYEPETKQQSTMWAFEDKPNPTKVVCGKSTSKQMVACFFGKTGHVATVPLEQRCTVNSVMKFKKPTRKDESLFTMATRVLAQWLKSAAF